MWVFRAPSHGRPRGIKVHPKVGADTCASHPRERRKACGQRNELPTQAKVTMPQASVHGMSVFSVLLMADLPEKQPNMV